MAEPSLRLPIALSIAAAVLTILLKSAAYYITGSVGLLSDAAESGVNLLAALTALLSLWYAARPVDPSHTYGHEKIEYFSSGLEGILILVAAGGIAWYAIHRLLVPEPLRSLDVGALVALAASFINFGAAQLLLRVGRKYGSIVLEADGRHLMTDVWTSVGVVAGLGLVWLTGIEVLDPILALVIAANIVWTGFDLVRRSFNGLMDHALPDEELARVRSAIESQLEPGMHYHALRTRQAGSRRFADFHLLVPGWFTVTRAHALVNRIEKAVAAALPNIEVTVHVEPIEERAAWEDSALLEHETGPLHHEPPQPFPPSPPVRERESS
ncbi:MAG TPA: cation diffusion facilitator family transporter [Gemmataceae bacterium]|nr:cation diffusion facilitator family transporter [Gemmataceae bacterium]